MAISLFASFRTYIFSSLLLASAVVTHAVYSKRFFYRSVVHLANSKLAVLAVANMALCSVLCIWRLIQTVFLGQLRFRERERLHLRARDAIIESCFAISVFREDFNAVFVGLVMTLLLVKSLHWLAKDRIEFLEEQPLSPRSAHIRLVSLMALLFVIDSVFVAHSVANTYAESHRTMYALFAFESAILMVDLLSDFVHYVFLVIDLSMDGRWEGKWLFSFYSELISDMCQLTVYILFFIYVQIHYSFPYHIIRELYMTFYKFQRRCSDFLRYRRVVATMNDLFADATEEQLAQGDRICIICREEMTNAKVLSCGHMFHARCLQSWLKRQLSCPTCRATIDVNPPARNQANANPNANANPAANQPDGNNNENNINNNNGDNNQNDAAVAGQRQALHALQQANNAAGAAPPGEAGARLLDAVNDWWQALLNDAGAPPPGGANARNLPRPPRPPLPPRPPQPNAAAPPGFLRGPNAIAHMQFRMRRRGALPPMPMPPGPAAQMPGQLYPGVGQGPQAQQQLSQAVGSTNSSAAPAGQSDSAASASATSMAPRAAQVPSTPLTSAHAPNALPLDRLLAVQEQIEVLRSEVQELVELATAEPPEAAETSSTVLESNDNKQDSEKIATTAKTTAVEDVGGPSAVASSVSVPTAAANDSSTAAAAEPATEVVDESEEEENEAARIRERRMRFLERGMNR